MTHLPVLAVVLPLLCAFCLPLVQALSNRARRLSVVLFATAQVGILLLLIPRVVAEGLVEYRLGGWGPEVGIVLVVDGFSLVFALLAAVGIWMVCLYSLEYVDRRETGYFVLLFIVLAGVTGMMLTGDLFNLYVFFELAAMAGFPLIAFARGRGAVEAAFRYMLYSTVASVMILLAIGLIYGATGALNLQQAAAGLRGADAGLRAVILGLLTAGFAVKIALVPFHAWLPEAYASAPSPVSALLSGVLGKTGIYALVRLLVTFGPDTQFARLDLVLLYLGTLSVVVGHCLAFGQDNFKKVLAYSSIAHVGIIMIGVGLGTAHGLAAALFHTINHMFMKTTAFLAVGQLDTGRGFGMAAMRGAGWQAPLATTALIVSALSLIGVPPLAGFVGKWEVTVGALREEHLLPVAAIAFGTLLAVVYYGRMVRSLLSKPPASDVPEHPAGLFTRLVLLTGIAGCLIPFVFWGRLIAILMHVAEMIRG